MNKWDRNNRLHEMEIKQNENEMKQRWNRNEWDR